MLLILRIFTILISLMMSVRADAYAVTNMADFLQSVKSCNTLDSASVAYSLSATTEIIVSADPNPDGYCIIAVNHPDSSSAAAASSATTDGTNGIPPVSYTCPLSKEAVDKLTSPDKLANAKNVSDHPGTKMSPEITESLSSIINCRNKNVPQVVPPPPPPAPPVGAVPAGTPLPLPPGVEVAPGSVPPGTPPGTIPTSPVTTTPVQK